MPVDEGEVDRCFARAVAWCRTNLRKYLPRWALEHANLSHPRWAWADTDWGQDVYPDASGVIRVNPLEAGENASVYGARYDFESLFVHEIVELALVRALGLRRATIRTHAVAQLVEADQRAGRGLGPCPVCWELGGAEAASSVGIEELIAAAVAHAERLKARRALTGGFAVPLLPAAT